MALNLVNTTQLAIEELSKRNLVLGEYGLCALSLDQLRDIGLSKPNLLGASCGIGIPYMIRNRASQSTSIGGIGQAKLLGNPLTKYLAIRGSASLVYCLGDITAETVIIVEGEFKAMCVHKALLKEEFQSAKVIGLRGVSNWSGRSENRLFLKSLMDELDGAKQIYIIFDYDGTDIANNDRFTGRPKYEVLLEERKLSAGLIALGLNVKICRIGMFNRNEKNIKFAIDDHLLRGGTLESVLKYSRPYSQIVTHHEAACYALNSFGVYSGEIIDLRTGAALPAARAELQWTGMLTRPSLPADETLRAIRVSDGEEDDRKDTDGTPRMVKVIDVLKSDVRTVRIDEWVYAPGFPYGDMRDGRFNLFKPFGPEVEGDITPWTSYVELCLRDRPDEIKFIHDWTAYLYQNPCKKNFTFITLAGKENGTGKSTIAETIAKIFGKSASEMESSRLFDKFNSYLEGLCLIVVNELASSKAAHVDQMKNFVTSSILQIESKGVNVRRIDNIMNMILTTNATSGTLVNENSRRDAIITMPHHGESGTILIRDAMKKLAVWLENGGVDIMRWWYGRRDISEYDPVARAPKFVGLDAAIMASKSDAQMLRDSVEDWIKEQLDDGTEYVVLSNELLRLMGQHFTGEERVHVGALVRQLQTSSLLKASGKRVKDSRNVSTVCYVFTRKQWADGIGKKDLEHSASLVSKLVLR